MKKRRFKNIYQEKREQTKKRFLALLRWQLGFVDEPYAFFTREKKEYVPRVVTPHKERIHNPQKDTVQITWIGHDSFLIQMNGIAILTDPIFSKRASPIQWLGPKRLVKPGITFESLPRIDYVVISHDHYDHLDYATIQQLGNSPKYIVPLGLKQWFQKRDFARVVEREWWQGTKEKNATFTAVPVQHFSGRMPFHFRTTQWAGWVIECQGRKIFFSGDTGYGNHFAKIFERFGVMDISLIPIGAYHPRWFMKEVHIDPREAVKIHSDLHSKQSIAMHWGTFKLTSEPLAEPPFYLQSVLKEKNIDSALFRIMDFGETVCYETDSLQ